MSGVDIRPWGEPLPAPFTELFMSLDSSLGRGRVCDFGVVGVVGVGVMERGAVIEGVGVGVARPESLSSLFAVASVSALVEEGESIDMVCCLIAPSMAAAS